MAAENSSVGVKLVDHNVAKVFEQARPAGVLRQDTRVQHVRVGEHYVALFADSPAGVGGRVTVVSKNAEAVIQSLVEAVKFRELILGKSFGRKQIQSASVRILKNRIQNG